MASRDVGACAYGKIVVIEDHGIRTYQASAGGEAVPVFCGNSTAAALACLGDGDIRTSVHGPTAAPYAVAARIDGDTVAQSWTIPPWRVEQRSWRGCVVLLLACLNRYAIVLGRLPDGEDPEAARRELLGATPAGKLAVIVAGEAEPIVEFYNSNGRHGGAPLTGVLTLALAAHSLPWLSRHFPDGWLAYGDAEARRRIRLPRVAPGACGRAAIDMPQISVRFAPLLAELAA
jgi:hypothetical protein